MADIQRNPRPNQTVGIGVAAQITGVEVHTLRYWEKEFAGYLNPIRTDGGQRRYRPEDIQAVFTLKRLLRDEMFSIAGARRHLKRQFREAA
jgi:DNA-binding transcriptional MerR regulator